LIKKVVLATNNPHKLREVRQIFSEFEVLSLKDCNISHDVIEDSDTFEGNALKKAREIANISGLPTIADDSGIVVEALNGAPGVYSARYSLGDADCDLNNVDESNNDKLLKNMIGKADRRARYVCAIAYVDSLGKELAVSGECHGEVAHGRSGTGGFGYDTIFFLPQFGCTMASISSDRKNKISHRSKALADLKELLMEM